MATAPRALIFDVDGTLYRQGPVRFHIAASLALHAVRHPIRGPRAIRALLAYRAAHETLRNHQETGHPIDVAAEQVAIASQRSGIPVDELTGYVDRWMHMAPLPLLMRARRAGLVDVLGMAQRRGIQLAAYSDYPAVAKLVALGVGPYFGVVVSAQDPEAGCLKPQSRGLQVVLDRMGVAAPDAWLIGDRLDVDGVAATRLGMRPVVLSGQYTMARLLHELQQS